MVEALSRHEMEHLWLHLARAAHNEAPPHDSAVIKFAPGFARRRVRKPRLPVIPSRRSSAEKEVYRAYLENKKQALYDSSSPGETARCCPCTTRAARCRCCRGGETVNKMRARVRTYKGSENSSQWERDPMRTIRQWSRTPECDPKKFPTELKIPTTRSKTILDRTLAFDSTGEKCPLGRFPRAVFYSARKRPHPHPQFY